MNFKKKYNLNIKATSNGRVKVEWDPKGFDQFQSVLDSLGQQMSELGETTSSKMGKMFDTSFNNFVRMYQKKVIDRMRGKKVPAQWPSLGKMTRKERGFLLDGNALKEEIEKFWYSKPFSSKDVPGSFKPKEEPPDFRFYSPKLDPLMQASSPALLRTGRLSRSISIQINRGKAGGGVGGTKKGGSRRGSTITYTRSINMQAKAVYAPIQFNGGSSLVWQLEKKMAKGKSIFIPIPKEFLSEIRSQRSILDKAGYEITSKDINVPARNPLFFDSEDVAYINDFLEVIGSRVDIDPNAFHQGELTYESPQGSQTVGLEDKLPF